MRFGEDWVTRLKAKTATHSLSPLIALESFRGWRQLHLCHVVYDPPTICNLRSSRRTDFVNMNHPAVKLTALGGSRLRKL